MQRITPRAPVYSQAILFLLFLFAGSYFYYPVDYDNSASRLYLVSSIVDFGHLHIDPYATLTIDKSTDGEHFYSNKAMGSPLLAAPFYWLQRQLPPWNATPPLTRGLRYGIRLITTTLPFALLGVILFRMALHLSGACRDAALTAMTYGLGSIALIHAGMFSGHAMAASFSFFSFALLYRLRRCGTATVGAGGLAFCAGLSAGIGGLCDFTAIFIALVLTVYAVLALDATRLKALFLCGGLLCAGCLCLYNWQCFGSPLTLSYDRMTMDTFAAGSREGFKGVGLPGALPLLWIVLSPSRGLFFIMPVFLFAVAGMGAMLRHRGLRPEVLVILAVTSGYLLINAGFYAWHGGWTFGPRYLVPMLPFLALPMVFARLRQPLFGAAFALSAIQVHMAATSLPHPPETIVNPIRELILPCMGYGYLAETWPGWLGLPVPVSLAVYVATTGLLMALGYRSCNRDKTGETEGKAAVRRKGLFSLFVAAWLSFVVVLLFVARTPRLDHVVSARALMMRHLEAVPRQQALLEQLAQKAGAPSAGKRPSPPPDLHRLQPE